MASQSQGPELKAWLRFADRFVPPEFRAHEERQRQGRTVVLSALGMALLMLTIMGARGLTTGQPELLRNAGLVGSAVCVSGALLFRLSGNLLVAGAVTPLTMTVLLAAVAHVEGLGLSAPMMFAAPLIPCLALAFLDMGGMYLFCALVILQAVLVIALPHLGVPRPPPEMSPERLEALQLFGICMATGLLAFLATVMERQRRDAERRLKLSEARHRALLEAVPDLMLRVDRQGRMLDVHRGDTTSIWPMQDLAGSLGSLRDVLPADLAQRTVDEIAATLAKNQLSLQEFRADTDQGTRIYEMRQMPSGVHEVTVILRDITSRKREQEQLERRAKHDSLTGLVNRREFRETLANSLELRGAGSERALCALLFIDLDRFKPINDVFGHAIGDGVLAQVGVRLGRVLREQDLAARHGGDEFTILLRDLASPEVPLEVAHRVLSALSQPMEVEGNRVEVGASIGVALFPTDARTVDGLMHCADVAMYAAKTAGGDTVQRFLPSLDAPKSHERRL